MKIYEIALSLLEKVIADMDIKDDHKEKEMHTNTRNLMNS